MILPRKSHPESKSAETNRIVHEEFVKSLRGIANLVEAAYLNDGETFIDYVGVKQHVDYVMREMFSLMEVDLAKKEREEELERRVNQRVEAELKRLATLRHNIP